MIPSPFAPKVAATGVDCTAIPHVNVVDCRSSSCFVYSCKDGFVPNAAHSKCVQPLVNHA